MSSLVSSNGYGAAEGAIRQIERALQMIFSDGHILITPAVETQMQKAIHGLRSGNCSQDALEQAEAIATLIASICQAQRSGMPNPYASKMLMLKRLVVREGAALA